MEGATLRAQTPTGCWCQETKSWVRLCNPPALGPWDRTLFSLCLPGAVSRPKGFPARPKQTRLALSDVYPSMRWPAATLTFRLPLTKPCSQTQARK